MSRKRYPPRIPRTASGFRAQFLRALPRGAWWAKRWLQAVEELKLGARAGRGRVYAEQGQVVALEACGTHVEARVVGGRPDPYAVRIDFRPLSGTPPLGAMTQGRILAGEMPTVVEELFAVNGVSPYPTLGADRFWCSCPDWSKPCKHIAAVLYLLADAMVRDPQVLLRLRGVLPEPGGAAAHALPLWRGVTKLEEGLQRIRRRVQGAGR